MKKERCSFVCSMSLALGVLWEGVRVGCLGNSSLGRGSWERRGGRFRLRVWGSWLVVGLGIGCRLPSLIGAGP